MGQYAYVVQIRVCRSELAALSRMADARGCTIEEMIRSELRLTPEPTLPQARHLTLVRQRHGGAAESSHTASGGWTPRSDGFSGQRSRA
jgi:hypothetical protein